VNQKDIKRKIFNYTVLFLGFVLLNLSCSNLFTGSATTDSDEAKLFDARIKIDSSNWTGAIEAINSMSSTYLSKREVKTLLASAYAGRCGLDIVGIASNLQNPGTTSFFGIFLSALVGSSSTEADDCTTAETTIKSISSSAAYRTVDENMLMAFIGFAKVGAYLAKTADLDGDGTRDAAFETCDDLNDTDTAEVGTGITNALLSLVAAGSAIGGTTVEQINTTCDALALAIGEDICAYTETSQFDSTQKLDAIRGMVGESSYGVGLGSPAKCVTPNDTIELCYAACQI